MKVQIKKKLILLYNYCKSPEMSHLSCELKYTYYIVLNFEYSKVSWRKFWLLRLCDSFQKWPIIIFLHGDMYSKKAWPPDCRLCICVFHRMWNCRQYIATVYTQFIFTTLAVIYVDFHGSITENAHLIYKHTTWFNQCINNSTYRPVTAICALTCSNKLMAPYTVSIGCTAHTIQ